MDQQDEKETAPSNDAFQYRMGLNDNKAGMEGLDKEKINKIIMDATKVSWHSIYLFLLGLTCKLKEEALFYPYFTSVTSLWKTILCVTKCSYGRNLLM